MPVYSYRFEVILILVDFLGSGDFLSIFKFVLFEFLKCFATLFAETIYTVYVKAEFVVGHW